MSHRDIFFRCITDIKFTAIYGNLWAKRLSKIGNFIDVLIGFILSASFCSLWIWQGHEKMLGGIMLLASFAQMLMGRYGLMTKAGRIYDACRLLENLYLEARDKWNSLEQSDASDGEYQKCAAYFASRMKEITALADADVSNCESIREKASSVMESQIKFDFT